MFHHFYYPLTLELTAIETGAVLGEWSGLELLMPDEQGTILELLLENIPLSNVNQSYGLTLKSEHLLPQQHIKWANDSQQDGLLRLSPVFQCVYATESYWPGQSVQGSNAQCTCDVDGQFYTVSGDVCALD